MKKIIQKDSSILRKIAKEVPQKDIASDKIKVILKDMIEALSKEPDGIAIAAPQIGESLQIFLIAKHELDAKENPSEYNQSIEKQKEKYITFINPKILKTSRKKEFLQEGCLSVRGVYGNVERAEKLTIRAYDENGKKFTRGASSFLAEVIQHEIDHLNGVLFIDKAVDIKEKEAIDKT